MKCSDIVFEKKQIFLNLFSLFIYVECTDSIDCLTSDK